MCSEDSENFERERDLLVKLLLGNHLHVFGNIMKIWKISVLGRKESMNKWGREVAVAYLACFIPIIIDTATALDAHFSSCYYLIILPPISFLSSQFGEKILK